MLKIRWSFRAHLTITLAAATVAVALASVGVAAGSGGPWAHASHTLNATDTAHLHLVKSGGSAIVEEGRATGALPGKVRAYLSLGATVIAHFTIYPSGGGSISGYGSGKLKGRPAEPSYGGTMTVTHGTGRYAHAHGQGGFFGVLNRETYALLIQTTGTLRY